MNSLAANSGGSISGQPGPPQDPMNLVNKLKDREKQDFMEKANFMSDLSLKQDRLRKLYGLDGSQQQQAPQNQSASSQQQMLSGMDPNAPKPGAIQQQELGIRQQQANTESQRVNQQGQLGQQAQDVKTKQEQLNQQKSDQIHTQKQQELEAKINESNGKLTQAQAALAAKNTTAEQQLQAHKDLAAAVEERHKLELAQKDSQFQQLKDQHQQVIDNLESQRKAGQNKTQTQSKDPVTGAITTNTRSGSAAQNVIKQNPDGTLHVSGGPTTGEGSHPNGEYDIPANKLGHWNSMYGSQEAPQQDLASQPGSGDAFRINPQE